MPFQVINQPDAPAGRLRPEPGVVRFDGQVSTNELEQRFPLIASGFEQSPVPRPDKVEVETRFGVRGAAGQGAVAGRRDGRAIGADDDGVLPPRGISGVDKILVDQRLIEESKSPQIAGFDPGDHPRGRSGSQRINLLADEVEEGFQGIDWTESVQNIVFFPFETRQTGQRVSLGCACGENDLLERADPLFDAAL